MTPGEAMDRYGCALFLAAHILGDNLTRDAQAARVDIAAKLTRHAFDDATVADTLADLRATAKTIRAQDPIGRDATSSTPAARSRVAANQTTARDELRGRVAMAGGAS